MRCAWTTCRARWPPLRCTAVPEWPGDHGRRRGLVPAREQRIPAEHRLKWLDPVDRVERVDPVHRIGRLDRVGLLGVLSREHLLAPVGGFLLVRSGLAVPIAPDRPPGAFQLSVLEPG